MKKPTTVLIALATLLASAIPSSAQAGRPEQPGSRTTSASNRCSQPAGSYKVTVRRTEGLVITGELYFVGAWSGKGSVRGATKQPGWPDWFLLIDTSGEWYVDESNCKLFMSMQPTGRPGASRWRSLTNKQTSDGTLYTATGYVEGVSEGHGYREGVFVMCSMLLSSC